MAIYIHGPIGKSEELNIDGVTLENVVAQVKNQPEGDLHVRIKSEGGSEQEGTDIYEYLKSLNRKIITYADGNVDSIATKLLFSGDERIGYKGESTSLIHGVGYPMPPGAILKVNELTYLKDESEVLNKGLAKFYAEKTGNTVEAFEPLMRDETELDADQMLSLGFLTELRDQPLRAVAFKTQNTKDMSKDAVTKEDLEKGISKFEAMFKKFVDIVKPKAVALVVQDANGTDIDFPDVAEDGMPAIGDKAMIDGSKAEGEVVMPSGETYVFADGALSEIKPSEEDDAQALKEENEQLQAKVNELEAQNKTNSEAIEEMKTAAVALKKEMSNIKTMAGSAFAYKPDLENPDDEDLDRKPASRKLFKKEEN